MIKVIITISLVFISVFSFGKAKTDNKIDKLTFKYINMYREYNNVPKITWDKDLYKISLNHSVKLITTNKSGSGITLFHSGTRTFENCMGFVMNKKVGVANSDFYNFSKEYFNLTKEDMNVDTFIAVFSVYTWHVSVKHRENMLNKNHKSGSVSIRTTLFMFKHGNNTFELKKVLGTSNFI